MLKSTLAEIDDRHGIQWRFDTPRYTVAFWAEEEDMAPEDGMEFPEDVEFARQDDPAHWFCAFVGVFKSTDPSLHDDDNWYGCVSYSVLGGCSYNSFREFYAGHRQGGPENRNCLATKARNVAVCHYFPDMVRQALSEARSHEIRNTMVAA
jgi:hypothetical protein